MKDGISVKKTPDGMSIVSIIENTPHIVVEFESATSPPAEWGSLSPYGQAIRDWLIESPHVTAAYGYPHGAVATVKTSRMPQKPFREEEDTSDSDRTPPGDAVRGQGKATHPGPPHVRGRALQQALQIGRGARGRKLMHLSVWIITTVQDPGELEQALEKAEKTADLFHERNLPGRNNARPPLQHDWRETGGRYSEDLKGPWGENWATGETAASRHREMMPKAVISPQGYPIILGTKEENSEEMRRVLLHWPQNMVIVQDWHR